MFKKTLLICITFICSLKANAYDPYRVRSITLGLDIPSISYKLEPQKNEGSSAGDKLNYIPNSRSFFNISAAFADLSIRFSFENNSEETKEDSLQKTNVFDLQLIGVYKKIFWEVYYQNYQNLFIQQEDELSTTDLPTANSYNMGVNLTFFTNKELKPRATLSNFNIKKETNWSWLQKAKVNRSRLWSPDGLIPDEFQMTFDEVSELHSIQTSELGYEFGVIGAYATKHFHTSVAASIGPTLFCQQFAGVDIPDRFITNISTSVIFDAGITDAKNKIFTLQTRFDGSTIPIKNLNFIRSRIISTISFRYFLP